MSENYIEQLADYIKKNLAKGYTLESLKWALISQGYGRIAIDRAIKIANEELAKKTPEKKQKPVIKIQRVEIIEEEKKGFWEKVKEFFS